MGWRVLLPATGADAATLTRVASLVRAATPISLTPQGQTCKPGGFRETPPAPMGAAWKLGLDNGAVATVVPDVMPCGQSYQSYAADPYATIDGRPVNAGALVPRLVGISQNLPPSTPLTVLPDTVAPGRVVKITGAGWVGGRVDLSVAWCRQTGSASCVVHALATVPVGASGRFSWSGALPEDLPTRGYNLSIQGKNRILGTSVSLRLG